MEAPRVKVFRTHPDALVPSRKSSGAAGYDLYTVKEEIAPPRTRILIPLEIVIEVPYGYYGRIAPRSGLAVKGWDTKAGVIDRDYRGKVAVVGVNTSNEEMKFAKGERIAQLILEKCGDLEIEEVPSLEAMTQTVRGVGGFGSTGGS